VVLLVLLAVLLQERCQTATTTATTTTTAAAATNATCCFHTHMTLLCKATRICTGGVTPWDIIAWIDCPTKVRLWRQWHPHTCCVRLSCSHAHQKVCT
jgi:hypothetical protein